MHQSISKKIFIYLFIYLLFGTINNKYLISVSPLKINQIKITGLSDQETKNLLSDLSQFKFKNLLFLDELKIQKVMMENNLIEKYTIFKKYPSSLEISIDKTKFLANIIKNEKNYFIGSNGRFIETKESNNEIPFIFGNFVMKEFLYLKELLNFSNLNYNDIKKFFYFPSGRWDIEIKSGITIKLPKDNIKESLELSIEILNNKNFQNIKIIDLRQSKQLITYG